MKVIVFDLGGTLMEYIGMPLSWVDYYRQGFEAIKEKYNCEVADDILEESIELLKAFNPRVNPREIEYTPEYIFEKVLEKWDIEEAIADSIRTFWCSLELKARIYPDTIPVLKALKEQGYVIATLSDLPNAMPDELFKKDIGDVLEYIDFYGSSSVFGYRKPNPKGLQIIAEKYKIPVEELIFVGDEEKDKQTAVNAKCRFIHIKESERLTKLIPLA